MATSIAVTINSVAYQVYADVASADSYLGGSISSQAVAWQASSDTDKKARCLVEATRWLDQLSWKGTAADADGLAWPRSGVDGYDQYTVPQVVINACIELAALFFSDADLKNTLNSTATAQKRLKAGSVEIEYFRGSKIETLTPIPTLIMSFIKSLLASSSASTIDGAYNTDREGDFGGTDDDYDLNY